MLETILFYVFGGVAVLSALFVILQRNVVHSAMFLAVTLLSVAGIFLTLHAEFLAGVQVIVYVGGILVLFVFVIMLIALRQAATERQFNRQWTVAVVTAAVLVVEFAYVIYKGKGSFVLPPAAAAPAVISVSGNSEQVGVALYTTYLLPFEIASILLLVAIVGAVVLAKKKTAAED
jgi:NADH-quinone oxidoreductase subunit J